MIDNSITSKKYILQSIDYVEPRLSPIQSGGSLSFNLTLSFSPLIISNKSPNDKDEKSQK